MADEGQDGARGAKTVLGASGATALRTAEPDEGGAADGKRTILGASGAHPRDDITAPPDPSADLNLTAPPGEPGAVSGPIQIKVRGPESLVGTILADRYRILKRLGEGGMGVVYLAEHVVLEKKLALKVLIPELSTNQNLVDRFIYEAKAATRIGHENIVDITDFGHTPSGGVFFAMEYLDGIDLGDHIKKKGRLHWKQARDAAMQICRGLGAAHRKGIVHRDLKPENIFLIKHGERSGFVKILDFGIAKFTGGDNTGPKQTKTGVIFGTPDYMSPEQASGTQLDHRADIYALGVILYEMVVGQVPFVSETFMGVLSKHMFSEPERPRAACREANIPPSFEAVVMKAMAKERDQRYQSMGDLAEAMMACTGDEVDVEADTAISVPAPQLEVADDRDDVFPPPKRAVPAPPRAEPAPAIDAPSGEVLLPADPDLASHETAAPVAGRADETTDIITAPEVEEETGGAGGGVILFLFAILVLGLGGGAVFLYSEDRLPWSNEAPPRRDNPHADLTRTMGHGPAMPAAMPPPVAPMTAMGKPPPPTEVQIFVNTHPPGADIFLGEKKIGRSPLRGYKVPYGKTALRLSVRKRYYRTVEISFTPTRKLKVDRKLEWGRGKTTVMRRPDPDPDPEPDPIPPRRVPPPPMVINVMLAPMRPPPMPVSPMRPPPMRVSPMRPPPRRPPPRRRPRSMELKNPFGM